MSTRPPHKKLRRALKVTSTTDAADWSALLAQFHSQYTKMADALRERVRSGAYASESEVIRDGLR
ncbi:MAG TPA: hypothetical protein VK054_04980, partial [Beutenbergiaceae bacterium]|nr:hypothetical protein [Beutenbergiaceae bacterium]